MREDPTSPRSSSASSRLHPLELLPLCAGVVLMADVAVESWPHTAVRWWAVGAAVVYAVVAAWSWLRQASWRTQLGVALGMMLTVIAVTAWTPGGSSEGIRLFTLSTPRLLALVAMIGVALAGLGVAQVARVPVGGTSRAWLQLRPASGHRHRHQPCRRHARRRAAVRGAIDPRRAGYERRGEARVEPARSDECGVGDRRRGILERHFRRTGCTLHDSAR